MSDRAGPAAAYSGFRERARHPRTHDFAAGYPFPLDDYQLQAARSIEDGHSTLVAAPTGAGKTVVGEFAVHLALATGRKCFYTTPIKALSNQKYDDLVRRYGPSTVGLLTGDNTVNGEAPVVVMTTEVLRNMLYAGSRTLDGLGYVVMDEVHYLADRSRGAVWEEVIIQLPESVSVVALSATVSNAEEFGEWLQTVRGETDVIVAERRPVPLFQHVMVGRRIYDLFESSDVDARAGFVREGTPVNERLLRVARDDFASARIRDRRAPRRGRGDRRPVGNGRRVWIPSRVDVVDRLQREGLLPAIVFIFSRAGCDAAVAQCLDANLRLTTPEERDEIWEFASAACAGLPESDLRALGFADFVDGLTRGVAAHHAGLLPVFKECVEDLFVRGLVKVVFATETLALGINMPARTVVIEKLTKFNGETHADLTPGEYTQLTGRAGRRGLDTEGHSVVLWQPGLDPSALAGLASTRTYPLRSSFRPSYNMAVNLVHQLGRRRARDLLELSFAQFQADRSVVGLATQVHRADEALAGYAEAARCDRGDFMEYAGLRQQVSEIEKGAAKARRAEARQQVVDSLRRLRPGDVVDVPAGRYAGPVVIIDPGIDSDEVRPLVLTATAASRRLSLTDFTDPVTPLARVRVPRTYSGRNPGHRRELAAALRSAMGRGGSQPRQPERGSRESDPEIARLRAAQRAHPCHRCPDREDHARWAERWFRLDKETRTLRRRIEKRTNSVARTFDCICAVLDTLGYLDGDAVTERGLRLRSLYSELDLVVAEALRTGLFTGLAPAELAAALSSLVFESRRPEDSPRWPSGRTGAVLGEIRRLWRELAILEKEQHLPPAREPDPGFAAAARAWADGAELDEVLQVAGGLSAGDFVRATKQVIDLAGQVADAAGGLPVRAVAHRTVSLLRRGVVVSTVSD